MKTIKLIAVAVIFTAVNVTAVIYLNNYMVREDKEPQDKPVICEPAPIKEVGLNGNQEAAILAAMIDRATRESVMRDTVIAQQIMKIQHRMDMHKQRMPLCPDCLKARGAKNQNYADLNSLMSRKP